MSFTQQYQDDLAMGCVCDFDVFCQKHAEGWWHYPPLIGDCAEHGHYFAELIAGEDGWVIDSKPSDTCAHCDGKRWFQERNCGACEYAPTCEKHGTVWGKKPPKPRKQSHAAYRREWVIDFKTETGCTLREAGLAFERMLNQSWDGCTCESCGGSKY